MAAHYVTCVYCGERFNRDKEPTTQVSARRYAHKECAEKHEVNKSQEEKDLEALEKYPSDSLRYHLVSNGPEKKDTNFTPEDFVNTHNSDIVNKFGNLINRTLKFKGIEKIELSELDEGVKEKIVNTYEVVGNLIETLEFREASRKLMELVEFANKYYDEKEPWKQRKEDIEYS